MKKSIKKSLALVLALAVLTAIALTGCGNSKALNTDSRSQRHNKRSTRASAPPGKRRYKAQRRRRHYSHQKRYCWKSAQRRNSRGRSSSDTQRIKDVDYAVINSNYAINAGLNPVSDSLLIEGSSSAYGNILVTKQGNENSPKILALAAALNSKQVANFISDKYNGSVISVVENPGDGYDPNVDYDALKDTTITVAASPTPHAEILEVAKQILAEKGIALNIQTYNDYVVPNTVVEDGTIDANYFQHTPYLDNFNEEKGTHLVSVGAIHVEPMALYGGKQTNLDALGVKGK